MTLFSNIITSVSPYVSSLNQTLAPFREYLPEALSRIDITRRVDAFMPQAISNWFQNDSSAPHYAAVLAIAFGISGTLVYATRHHARNYHHLQRQVPNAAKEIEYHRSNALQGLICTIASLGLLLVQGAIVADTILSQNC